MQNKERFESLRSLAPMEAIQAWLDGDFGFGDEPALIEAIRKDPQVRLSDAEIMDAMCDAMDEGLSAQACLKRLSGVRRNRE